MKQARFESATVTQNNLVVKLSVRQGAVYHGYVVRVPIDDVVISELIHEVDSAARRRLVLAWSSDELPWD